MYYQGLAYRVPIIGIIPFGSTLRKNPKKNEPVKKLANVSRCVTQTETLKMPSWGFKQRPKGDDRILTNAMPVLLG